MNEAAHRGIRTLNCSDICSKFAQLVAFLHRASYFVYVARERPWELPSSQTSSNARVYSVFKSKVYHNMNTQTDSELPYTPTTTHQKQSQGIMYIMYNICGQGSYLGSYWSFYLFPLGEEGKLCMGITIPTKSHLPPGKDLC